MRLTDCERCGRGVGFKDAVMCFSLPGGRPGGVPAVFVPGVRPIPPAGRSQRTLRPLRENLRGLWARRPQSNSHTVSPLSPALRG